MQVNTDPLTLFDIRKVGSQWPSLTMSQHGKMPLRRTARDGLELSCPLVAVELQLRGKCINEAGGFKMQKSSERPWRPERSGVDVASHARACGETGVSLKH